MTQEEKELLMKDLCARLPYGIKVALKRTNCHDSINKASEKDIYSFRTGRPLEEDYGQHDYYKVIVTDIKPYLFPLSSMTEEQKKKLKVMCDWHDDEEDAQSILVLYHKHFVMNSDVIDWLNENHFDYRGLIEKGLAIDATGLNIY